MNVVDAVDVVRNPRPKKNRKRWCKGKEGVSHQFVQVARSRCITFERGIYLYTTYPTPAFSGGNAVRWNALLGRTNTGA